MNNVFLDDIKDWESWGKVFQSIPAFEKLIKRIFEREGLNYKEISHLTAGSNAVFKVDNFVVKIFAPIESGFNTEIDYNSEILGMKRAMELGINIPNITAASFVEDKYLFRYIIMDYIDGKDAKDILNHYSVSEKIKFVHQLKENMDKMNTEFKGEYPAIDVKERIFTNTRWNIMSNKIIAQVKELVSNYHMLNKVYVHGDITGENAMISEEGKLYIIDFADGRIAPKEYEFPPIIFDLFDFDKIMINEFIGNQEIEDFVEQCFYGVLMHEFGAYFVKLICERLLGKTVDELVDLLEVKEGLFNYLAFSKKMESKDFPKIIELYIKNMNCTKDNLGCSGASVYCFANYDKSLYLKVEKANTEFEHEQIMLQWLLERLPVPQIIAQCKEKGYDYLLMTKAVGEMGCSEQYLNNPEKLVYLLAKGIKMLQQVNISDCPFECSLKNKLNIARKRIENDEIDMNDWEGNTQFSSPLELYNYLVMNQPEEEFVFSHGDYCLPNVFFDKDEVTGFIDLGRAGISDKWQDIALCIRSLKHNIKSNNYIDLFFEYLEIEPNYEKINYYILLDELF